MDRGTQEPAGGGFVNRFDRAAPTTLVQAEHFHLHSRASARISLNDFWHPNAPSAGFVGRDREFAELEAALADRNGNGVVQPVSGMAGIGKTQLATAFIRRHRDDYPDGRIFYDFQSYSADRLPETSDDALLQILPTIRDDVPVSAVYQLSPEGRQSLWRESVSGRRLIMVWDNVKQAEQVSSLLVRQPGCATIVTSREAVDLIGAAPPIHLDAMEAASALTLFRRIAGDDHRPELVQSLIEFDLRMPLLIEIHAEAVRSGEHRLEEILYDLQAESRGTDARGQERLFSRFDGSYQYLSSDQRRVFRALGAHPGKAATAGSLSAVLGIGLDRILLLLNELIKLGLAQRDHRTATSPEPRLRAYSAHDLLRTYGADRAEREGDRQATQTGLCAHYRAKLRRYSSKQLTWFETEAGSILNTALVGSGPVFAELALAAGGQFYRVDRNRDAQTAYTHAARCFKALDDQRGLVRAMRGLGDTHRVRDFEKARAHYREAAKIHAKRDDLSDLAHAHRWIGDVEVEWGHYEDAIASYGRSVELYREHGDPIGLAHAMRGLGNVMVESGDADAAETYYNASDAAYGDRNPRGRAQTLRGLGDVARLRGDFAHAGERYREAAVVYIELGDEAGVAHALRWQGHAALGARDLDRADNLYNQAAQRYQVIGEQFGLAKAWQGLGEVAHLVGDPAVAIYYLKASARLFKAIGEDRKHDEVERLLNNLDGALDQGVL